MRVSYIGDFPKDIRKIVEPILDEWLDLLPTWCQQFRVMFDSDTQAVLASSTNYRNRWATLYITAEWFEQSKEGREIALLHELIHVLIAPLVNPTSKVLDALLKEDSNEKAFAESIFKDGEEAAVEDMANAIYRMVRKTT